MLAALHNGVLARRYDSNFSTKCSFSLVDGFLLKQPTVYIRTSIGDARLTGLPSASRKYLAYKFKAIAVRSPSAFATSLSSSLSLVGL
jgi:hypothetical protein